MRSAHSVQERATTSLSRLWSWATRGQHVEIDGLGSWQPLTSLIWSISHLYGQWYPTVELVMPFVRTWDETEEKELQLDLYELSKFHNYAVGGVRSFVLDGKKQLPTVLHSAGNQLNPCSCGCRSPLSIQRLEQKGLIATVVPLPASQRHRGVSMQHARYLHPCEMFVLNGGPPDRFPSAQPLLG